MPKLTAKIENPCTVACSGGPDSLAALVFAKNHNKRRVTALFIFHDDGNNSVEAHKVVSKVCDSLEIPLVTNYVYSTGEHSKEHEWGIARHQIYRKIDGQVILGHTLDDAVERWIIKSLTGNFNTALYPFVDANVARPFLLWSKEDCMRFLSKNKVEWHEDPTNSDSSNLRSWMRASNFVETCTERFSTKFLVKKKIEERCLPL